jgi:hypothetical protein
MNPSPMPLLAAIAALVVSGAPARAEPPPDDTVALAPNPDPNFQVNTALSGRRYSISDTPEVPNTSGSQETLSMAIVAFGTPLHDDDSPYSLQPFTQRENTISISVDGGHFDTANAFGGVDRTEWYTGVGVGFDTYVKRWLAVFAGASYGYFDLHDVDLAETTHSFSGDVGVGVRHRDTRVDLSVAEQGNRTSGPWRSSLTLSAFTVIRRRVSLTATGTLVQNGEEGFFDVELFPTKKAGVFASAFAGRFEPYSDPIVVKRYVGAAGFAGWFDATAALVGQYSLTYETDPATPQVTNGYNELSHTFLLEAYFRFQ